MYLLYQSSQPLAFLCWKQLANALERPLVTSQRENDLGPWFPPEGEFVPSQERLCARALRAMCQCEASYVWVYLLISGLPAHGHVVAVNR